MFCEEYGKPSLKKVQNKSKKTTSFIDKFSLLFLLLISFECTKSRPLSSKFGSYSFMLVNKNLQILFLKFKECNNFQVIWPVKSTVKPARYEHWFTILCNHIHQTGKKIDFEFVFFLINLCVCSSLPGMGDFSSFKQKFMLGFSHTHTQLYYITIIVLYSRFSFPREREQQKQRISSIKPI